MSSSSRNIYSLQGLTPYSKLTGKETDISALAEFGWYEWCYFRDATSPFPYPNERLGRCLGPTNSVGSKMSQYILNDSANVLPQLTVRKLTRSEMLSTVERMKREVFDKIIFSRLGNSYQGPGTLIDPTQDPIDRTPETYEYLDDVDDHDNYDEYINMEVLLPREGGATQPGKIIRRTIGDDGETIGKESQHPLLDTRIYDVEFPDGGIERLAANRIAVNLYAHADEYGYKHTEVKNIINHRTTPEAILKKDAYVTDKNGRRHKRVTTKGWELQVEWMDSTISWIPLVDMKESVPVQVAEYAVANKINKEPAFAWWVPHTMKKRTAIIAAVNKRVRQTTHKYGIKIPRSKKEALQLDLENGNHLWEEALKKEMTGMAVAFKLIPEGELPAEDHKYVGYHLVWDVKMDFTRKARLVAEGHKTPDPAVSTFAGVVSRESVRIALTYAALHDLDVQAADISNAYLQAPCSGKYYTRFGPEFGDWQGRKAYVVRATYGLKEAGADFRNHLRDCMNHLSYKSTNADNDVWLRRSKLDDGTDYYEYLLLYVDDCLAISHRAVHNLHEIGKYFTLKPGSIGPPKIYLGGKVSKVVLPNGIEAHAFSSTQYVRESVKNVEAYMKKKNYVFTHKTISVPIPGSYHPELDGTEELDDEESSYYQSLIGILRWIVELGRIDISYEASIMASHTALPRAGHLRKVFHIFGYLKHHANARLVFDPTYPVINYNDFPQNDWEQFYGQLDEELPHDMVEPLGREMIITVFVDADLAGEKVRKRSRTGFLVYLNRAPIYWYSKTQKQIETGTFGAEFIAMKQCCEYVRGLRYKLRIFGINVLQPAFVYGDNQAVLKNVTLPESSLNKKCESIAYHFVREGVARGEWLCGYVPSEHNSSDTLTKTVPAGSIRQRLVSNYLYDVYE